MGVDVLIEDDRWGDLTPIADRATAAVLIGLGMEPSVFEISVLACDDQRIAALNADFRNKATPTNVLSWPAMDRGVAVDGEMPLTRQPGIDAELGDIAISYDTCKQEADLAGIAFDDHVTHLLVHGTLHLLGFDHIRDMDAALMEGLETEILGKMGISDPYREMRG